MQKQKIARNIVWSRSLVCTSPTCVIWIQLSSFPGRFSLVDWRHKLTQRPTGACNSTTPSHSRINKRRDSATRSKIHSICTRPTLAAFSCADTIALGALFLNPWDSYLCRRLYTNTAHTSYPSPLNDHANAVRKPQCPRNSRRLGLGSIDTDFFDQTLGGIIIAG